MTKKRKIAILIVSILALIFLVFATKFYFYKRDLDSMMIGTKSSYSNNK